METDAYIALGSNQGDREFNLLRAISELGRISGIRVTGLSRFYETAPVGMAPGQPPFYNAVVRVATLLPPRELFEHLVRIESTVFGRTRSGSCDSRSIDLDLLLYAEQVISQPDLTVPHPRLAERRFVLQPLHDIAPDLRHPVHGRTISELLLSLPGQEQVLPI